MKNILILLTLLISYNGFSQEEIEQKQIKNIIKLNAVPLFNGVFEFQYERVLSSKSSIQIGFGTGGNETTDRQEFQDMHLNTFGRTLNNPKNLAYSEKTFSLNIDYKYFFTQEQIPKGLYFSPSIQYINYKENYSGQEQNSSGNGDGTFDFFDISKEREFKLYNVRALIGYQFIIAKFIALNPYFGPSFLFGDATDFFDREDTNEKGFGLNVGFYVGVGF